MDSNRELNISSDDTLDLIHAVSRKLQCLLFICPSDSARHKKIKNVCLASLSELDSLINELFEHNGESFMAVFKEVSELDNSISKLLQGFNATVPNVHSIVTVNKSNFSELICDIYVDISSWERKFDVQAELWRQKRTASAELNKSICQFSYGTTSPGLWQKVVSHQSWSNRLNGEAFPIVSVFGSSQGLLCFYSTCFCTNVRVRGYEILPLLHNKALEISSRYSFRKMKYSC